MIAAAVNGSNNNKASLFSPCSVSFICCTEVHYYYDCCDYYDYDTVIIGWLSLGKRGYYQIKGDIIRTVLCCNVH